jgi:WD40 repeat protein
MSEGSAAPAAGVRFQYTAFMSYSHAADGRLTSVLQSRLQTFAKPWYRRRAIRVFRDTTGLGVTPDLWQSIRAALDTSQFFILFASEGAARSEWVAQEVDAWLRVGSADRLLVVWTDGGLAWDRAAGDFDWARTTCLPSRLRGVFPAEPLHLDLRWARASVDLSPRRPELLDAVARLSATLRQQPLDDLIGEDVRQHRRTRRLSAAAVATLAALLVGAVAAAVVAVQQRNVAREQQRIAEERGEESRQRLVRVMVANGLRRIDEADLSGSALWFAEALRLEASDPRGRGLQRMRVRSALGQHPGLVQVWSTEPRAQRRWIRFGHDGQHVVTDALEEDLTSAGPRLWNPETGSPVPLSGPPRDQRLLAVHPAREVRLVTADADGTVRVWDGSSVEVARLAHPARVTSAEFSPDGRALVTESEDRGARLWNPASGQLLHVFAHDSPLLAAGPTRDRARVLTITGDMNAHVWTPGADVPARRHLVLPHPEPVQSVDVSPDGRRALTLEHTRTARLWDLSGDRPSQLRSWIGVNHAELSADGRLLVMATHFGEAEVWDAREAREVTSVRHGGFVLDAAFSLDGKRFATASTDRTARVWDARSGTPLTAPLYHDDTVTAVTLSPDRARLATITAGGTVRVWGSTRAPAIHPQPGAERAVFHPDGRSLLVVGPPGARLWDLAARTSRALAVSGQLYDAAFSPDGRHVVTASRDPAARIRDVQTGAEVMVLEHGRYVRQASFRPDGRWLATAGRASGGEDDVVLWDLQSRQRMFSLPHESPVTDTRFTPDGRRLLTVGFAGDVRVWDLELRREVLALRRREGRGATLSPDGERLAVIEPTGVAIYDMMQGRALVSDIRNDAYRLGQAAFAPDGRVLLVMSEASARIHDAHTGRPLTPPMSHGPTARMGHAVFSPDGRRVATVADDHHVRIWDAGSGQALTPPLPHRHVRHASFSPDGLQLVTTGADVVQLWDLSDDGSTEPDARLALLAQVLAARRIDATGAVLSLEPGEFRDAWAKLRGR